MSKLSKDSPHRKGASRAEMERLEKERQERARERARKRLAILMQRDD
tara:strand:- start:5654 stop:5794 length:141 start_codon:yes stop_codon:yes gene_type:complete